MHRTIGLAVSILALCQVAFGAQAPDIDKVSETYLRAHLGFIASDLLEGRDTPSRGLDLAANYIAAHLAMYGVQPGGTNGSYFQPITLSSTRLHSTATSLSIGGTTAVLGKDFLPRNLTSADLDAEAVFIASGYANRSKNIDPYADFDVKGKVIVTDGSLPEGVTMRDVFQDSNWESPDDAAARLGALAVITISGSDSNAAWERSVERLSQGGRYRMDSGDAKAVPSITVSKSLGESLRSGISAGTGSAPHVRLKLAVQVDEQHTQNVIGIIPGSDPQLKAEYIALGAHYDHVGIGRPDASGDTIYNGADDDGSGTVALLEIARTVAQGTKPKRSLIFVWHCGEEKGLWGSQYFAANPTIDFHNLILQINLDMISMSKKPGDTNPKNANLAGPNELFVIGPRIVSSDITKTVEDVNNSTLKLDLNPHYDSLDDPERIFFRSDHYSYVAKGVPAVFFFSGPHEFYHQPGDQVDKVDFAKLTKATKLMYALAFEFASQSTRPRIDGPVRNIIKFDSFQ